MRRNIIAERIRTGKPALGLALQTFSPIMIQAMSDTGIHFVWLDLEHGGPSPYDTIALENLARTADGAGLATLARIPENNPRMITKVLDAGINSVLLTGIDQKSDAEKAVCASRFLSSGKYPPRGAGVSHATDWKSLTYETAKALDGETLVGIMIESKETVNNIGDIASVEGLDFAFIGPTDLSVSLEVPFDRKGKVVEEAIEKATNTAREHYLILGRAASSSEDAQKALNQGYRIVRLGFDTTIVASTVKDLVGSLK